MKTNKIKYLRKWSASNFVTKLLVIAFLLLAGCNNEQQWAINPVPLISNANKFIEIEIASMSIRKISAFIVLASNTIINYGESVIQGNVGVGANSITGFQSESMNHKTSSIKDNKIKGKVVGTVNTSSANVEQALNDEVLLYYFMVNQTPDIVYKTINQLDEQTFTPGIYSFPSWVNLGMNGTIYLDFQGNDQALFIFQVGSSLTTMSNSNIVAINTTSSKIAGDNVFWVVGSSANISGNSFIGNVIAIGDISMSNAGNTSGATNVYGRIISLRGSLTMIKSVISKNQNTPKEINQQINTNEHFVTGGGSFKQINYEKDTTNKGGNLATFGLSCGIKNGQYWGLLSFVDHTHKGTRVKSINIKAFTVIDLSTREIKGVAKVNNRDYFDYTLIVKDKGEDGNSGFFDLKLSNGYKASGPLMDGKIQFHMPRSDTLGMKSDIEYESTQLVSVTPINQRWEGWRRNLAFSLFEIIQ